ncbi:MAG TPA: amidohydrolase family protein [Candidatus Sulfotelmatobacter sp.]|nr:amidohydrolase family protein [Candidatus Sulfotelmatobacter sp.]
MVIDAHQHFWRFDPVRDAWITEEMSAIWRDFLPADLAAELDSNGVDATIAVQADQSEAETEFLLGLAEGNRRIAGVVGWLDLRSAQIEKRLEHFAKFSKLRGLRHVAQAEPDERFLVGPDFVRGVACLKRFQLAYDILIHPRQLPAAIELVGKLPEQRFVVDHLAKPGMNATRVEPWASQIRELAANPNVCCKISGLVTEGDWKSWKAADFEPYLDVVFEAFGAERLMFGSDWPVCLVAATYAQVKSTIEFYVDRHAAHAKSAIFGDNAQRFYQTQLHV